MPRRSRNRKKKQQGGMLKGPSHEQGGIPAVVGGSTPVELEGGEYIINAQTVNAVGTQFLDQLNSTQTSYHTGGFGAGQLPSPSQYKRGGKIGRTKMRRGGRPRRRMQEGGQCPEGQHWMPPANGQPGYCMEGETHPGNGYRKGGRTNNNGRSKMRRGGKPNVRRGRPTMRRGGRPVAKRGRPAMRRGGRPVAGKPAMRRGGRPVAEKPAMRRGGRPVARKATMRRGGRPVARRVMQRGGRPVRRFDNGGMSCPPGQYMSGGQCVGGMRRGGRPRKFQTGGGMNCPSGNYGRDGHGNTICV